MGWIFRYVPYSAAPAGGFGPHQIHFIRRGQLLQGSGGCFQGKGGGFRLHEPDASDSMHPAGLLFPWEGRIV